MLKPNVNEVAELPFAGNTTNQYGTIQGDGVKGDLATDWSWHHGIDLGSVPGVIGNFGDQGPGSNPWNALTSVTESEIERARIVDMRNSIRMHTLTVSADQLTLVETPIGVTWVTANENATSSLPEIFRLNRPHVISYSVEDVAHNDVDSLSADFPEFEHVIREAHEDGDTLPTFESLSTGRLLRRALTQLTSLNFDSFLLTSTVWLTAEMPSRKHVTIMCKEDGGIMVVFNLTGDPIDQGEMHFSSVREFEDGRDTLHRFLTILEAERAG